MVPVWGASSPPYRFDVGDVWKEGKNTIMVLVTNTLIHQQKDYMSMTMPVEPSGLLGPVEYAIRKRDEK